MIRRLAFPAACAAAVLAIPQPAAAQLFLNPPRFASEPVTGADLSPQLPGATDVEQLAATLWTLRMGLNVAALQCDAFPTLLTRRNYNGMLAHHGAELKGASDTLEGYFRRQSATVRDGQRAYDAYQNRLGTSFSTVSSQLTFCQVAASVSRDAVWAPRGSLAEVATGRLRELRGSTAYTREPLLVYPWLPMGLLRVPNLDPRCWDRKGRLKEVCAVY